MKELKKPLTLSRPTLSHGHSVAVPQPRLSLHPGLNQSLKPQGLKDRPQLSQTTTAISQSTKALNFDIPTHTDHTPTILPAYYSHIFHTPVTKTQIRPKNNPNTLVFSHNGKNVRSLKITTPVSSSKIGMVGHLATPGGTKDVERKLKVPVTPFNFKPALIDRRASESAFNPISSFQPGHETLQPTQSPSPLEPHGHFMFMPYNEGLKTKVAQSLPSTPSNDKNFAFNSLNFKLKLGASFAQEAPIARSNVISSRSSFISSHAPTESLFSKRKKPAQTSSTGPAFTFEQEMLISTNQLKEGLLSSNISEISNSQDSSFAQNSDQNGESKFSNRSFTYDEVTPKSRSILKKPGHSRNSSTKQVTFNESLNKQYIVAKIYNSPIRKAALDTNHHIPMALEEENDPNLSNSDLRKYSYTDAKTKNFFCLY